MVIAAAQPASADPAGQAGHSIVSAGQAAGLTSKRVVGYFSCSPTCPFVKPVELYQTPETGATGSYGNANIITYNSHDHPDMRSGNTLLVSYNVNSLDANTDLYADVSIYRPRFVAVTLAAAK